MASAAFTVNGLTSPPEIALSFGSTVTLALVSASGVRTVAWQIIGKSHTTAPIPTITSTGSPVGVTASFTMPTLSATSGVAYLVRCVVNGGVDDAGQPNGALTATALVGVVDASGTVPFSFGEQFERSSQLGYTDRLNSIAELAATGGTGIQPVKIVLTANDTLSGLAARDGYTPIATERALVVGQTTASQNGIYAMASGAWTRTSDADADSDFVLGVPIYVTNGTQGAGSNWALTSGTTLAGSKAYEIRGTPRVRTVITSNVSLSSCSASQDVTLAAGDYVLLARQTTSSQNAVYAWAASGVLTKIRSINPADQVNVFDGLQKGRIWMLRDSVLNPVSDSVIAYGVNGARVKLVWDGDIPSTWVPLFLAEIEGTASVAAAGGTWTYQFSPAVLGFTSGHTKAIAVVDVIFSDGTGQDCYRHAMFTNGASNPTLLYQTSQTDGNSANNYITISWSASGANCLMTLTNNHPTATALVFMTSPGYLRSN